MHDFTMFKNSDANGALPENISAILDSAYQGINLFLPNAVVPFKATKNTPLTPDQKAINHLISRVRIVIEHIHRELKIFRICKETYRGKGQRGLKRVKIISSLHNHRLWA